MKVRISRQRKTGERPSATLLPSGHYGYGWAGPKLEIRRLVSHVGTGAQGFRPSCSAFPGSWIRFEAPGTWSGTHIGCEHPTQRVSLIYQHTCLRKLTNVFEKTCTLSLYAFCIYFYRLQIFCLCNSNLPSTLAVSLYVFCKDEIGDNIVVQQVKPPWIQFAVNGLGKAAQSSPVAWIPAPNWKT